jgi:protein-disulfide isomerase
VLARLSMLALIFAVAGATACGGPPAGDASTAQGNVDLPGVDTRDFTPREKHEFSRYVRQLPAPCSTVAVPVAQCILEKRDCPACASAAALVAKAVREGMAPEQVESSYRERFGAGAAKAIPLEGSPSRGPEAGVATMVEFADFECPFCQRKAPELDQLWESRKDKLRFVYKFMPLAMHPHSEIAARAAIAAQAQGKFWEMHRVLFKNGGHLEQADLEKYASSVGLDLARFRADMQSPETTARIDRDLKLADSLGVKATPTLFIDGREYDPKLDLADWVDGAIAAHRPPEASAASAP